MIILKAIPPLLLTPSFCRAFHAGPFITPRVIYGYGSPSQHHDAHAHDHHHHQQHLNMNTRAPAEVPEKLRQANLKAHNEVWDSRRGMARATLSAAKAVRGARESLAGPPNASSKDSLVEDGKGSLVISAIALAVAAATLRLGGRAALISVRTQGWYEAGLSSKPHVLACNKLLGVCFVFGT